jgi:hypothetical protein
MNADILEQQLKEQSGTSRRQALKRLGMGAVTLTGLGLLAKRAEAAIGPVPDVTPISSTDADVLQFALNLEYLEAQYYSYGVTGHGIEASLLTGSGMPGNVRIKANPKVNFMTAAFRQYATEIAADERLHVGYLRNVLKFTGVQPVAQPAINLLESFNALAQAAGIGTSFDPFANEANFLLGAFIFEDVGVTAYTGAAQLIQNQQILAYAGARLLGTEAYHASLVRTTIFAALGATGIAATKKISDLRDILDGPGDDDQPLLDARGNANIVPTDGAGRVFGRTARQVLNIVYFAPNAHAGGFFPNGLNGTIS